MQCLACGAEMHLVQVTKDDKGLVSGHEHQTWHCSACNEVERRFVFIREKTSPEKVPAQPTHPETPASSSRAKTDEPLKPATAPMPSPAPAANDEPIAPPPSKA
jgi:hypothetical protein